jgi:hypothetical protein
MYGGMSTQTARTLDDVYVLSLPGFVFFKASGSSTKRADHACVLVGKRQMLSIGGTDGYLPFPDSLLQPDQLQNGLTAMRWSAKYNAQAAAYDSPDAVKTWYSQGGLSSVSWSSDEVKQLFSQCKYPILPMSCLG